MENFPTTLKPFPSNGKLFYQIRKCSFVENACDRLRIFSIRRNGEQIFWDSTPKKKALKSNNELFPHKKIKISVSWSTKCYLILLIIFRLLWNQLELILVHKLIKKISENTCHSTKTITFFRCSDKEKKTELKMTINNAHKMRASSI